MEALHRIQEHAILINLASNYPEQYIMHNYKAPQTSIKTSQLIYDSLPESHSWICLSLPM